MSRFFTNVVFALALAASAFAQETEQQRQLRLSELRANNARFQNQLVAKPAVERRAVTSRSITLGVKSPVFATIGQAIRWFSDIDGDGKSDVSGTFWTAQDGGIMSLAQFGSYLYAHDGRSSILRFTDVNNNGIADSDPTEVFAGATYTNRLLPYAIDKLYAEDNGRPRLVKYNVGVGQATAFSQGLPVLSDGYITGSVLSNELRTIFTIDQNHNVVRSFPLNADNTVGAGSVVFSGNRITNISVDGSTGSLIVLQAGECISAPVPPSIPGTSTPVPTQTPTICSSSILTLVRLNSFVPGTKQQQLAVGGWMFNVEYSSYAHSMLATGGKVYVVVYASQQPNSGPDYSSRQMIVSYDYLNAKPGDNQQGTVFVDENTVGDGFITSLAKFDGGPVTP